jgi:hypothetical protein
MMLCILANKGNTPQGSNGGFDVLRRSASQR